MSRIATVVRAVAVVMLTLCWSAPAKAQITMISDTFTGANNTSLTAHAPDVNLPQTAWTIRTSGTIVLNGNAAKSTQQDYYSWPPFAAIDSNTSDGTVAVDWTPGAGMPYGPRSGLVFRMSDQYNYWFAGYGFQGTALALWKYVNGTPGLMTSVSVPNPLGSTHHLEVRLNDAAIEVWWDGAQKIQWTDAYNASNTMHGIEWVVNEDWASTFDNFIVQTPAYQTTSSVVVTPAGSLTGVGAAQFLTATALNAQGQTIPHALFHWTLNDPTHGQLQTSGYYAASAAAVVALTGDVTATATMIGGPSASASITVDPSRTMIFDNFTDANGTALGSHVPTSNAAHGAWVVHADQPMTIQNGSLTSAQNDAPYQPIATIDGSTSDGIVSADWNPAPGLPYGPVGGVIFRVLNDYNYWFAGYGLYGTSLGLYKFVSGSGQLVAYASPPVQRLGRVHHIEVRLAGSSISVWCDGVFQFSTTDSYASTATRHGLMWGAGTDWASTFDNFAVQLPALPAPTHVTVSPATVTLPPGGTQTFTAQALDAANAVIPGTLFHWTVASSALGQVTSTSYYATSARVYGITGNVTVTATPVSGASGSASVTMDATTTLVFDTFTGSDGVLLPSHAPDIDVVGAPWIVHTTDTIELSGNRARSTQQVSPYLPVAMIDASVSEGVVAADWTPAAGLPYGPISGVVGRASDFYNYWFGGYGYEGTQLGLWKMVNGTPFLVTYGSIPSPLGQTHHIELRFSGPSVQLWWDGILQLQVSDSYNQTATQCGLVWGAGSDYLSTFDNFSVQGVPSTTVTQVVVTPGNATVALGGLQILTAQARDAQNQVIPNALFHWTVDDPSGATVVTSNYFASSAIVRAVAHNVTVTATMAWGPSASASIVADSTHTLVYDTFNASENTLLTTHAPDINAGGGAWQTPSGQPIPVIRFGEVVPSAYTATYLMQTTIETNATDVHVGADWSAATGMPYGPIGGIVFRQRDDQNFWFAGYGWLTFPLGLWQVVNGNWVPVVWANVGNPAGNTHHIEVVTSGLAIEVWWDGVRQIQYSSAFAADGTRAGFKWYPQFDWASTFDTLSATGTPRCVNQLGTASMTTTYASASGSFTISSAASCNWHVETDAPWITISSGANGVGNGTVSYAVSANSSFDTRIGTILVGGRLFRIVQGGMPYTCTFDTWPVGWSAPGSGGTFSFDVHQNGGCAWFTSMDVPGPTWIQVSGNSGGTAIDGTVTYTLEANPNATPRSVVIHIGAGSPNIGSVDYTVTQSGVGGGGSSNGSCATGLSASPGFSVLPADGGAASLQVSASQSCSWQIVSTAPWISLGLASATGNATVEFSVPSNDTGVGRVGNIVVGQMTVPVYQASSSTGAAGIDRDQDGVDDGIEETLARRFFPVIHYDNNVRCPDPHPAGALHQIKPVAFAASHPVAFTPGWAWASPDYFAIRYAMLYFFDCGIWDDHNEDNESFVVMLRWNYALQDWQFSSITTDPHRGTGVCEERQASNAVDATGHPQIWVGTRKHSNYVRPSGGCAGDDGTDDPGFVTESRPANSTNLTTHYLFNIGEINRPIVTNLGDALGGLWNGLDPWHDRFGGAGYISDDTILFGYDLTLSPPPVPPVSPVVPEWFPYGFICGTTPTLSISSDQIAAAGATHVAALTANKNCAWSVSTNVSWITLSVSNPGFPWPIPGGLRGAGNAVVTYTVAPNSGGTRSGVITVGTNTIAVIQIGPQSSNATHVALRAVGGQYLSASGGGGSAVVAAGGSVGAWEAFTLIDLGSGNYALQASNGQYVVADFGVGDQLYANRSAIGAWETFRLVDLGSGLVALQASNDRYVSAQNGGGGPVFANRGQIGPWETFLLTNVP